jgi:hypothetical protein
MSMCFSGGRNSLLLAISYFPSAVSLCILSRTLTGIAHVPFGVPTCFNEVTDLSLCSSVNRTTNFDHTSIITITFQAWNMPFTELVARYDAEARERGGKVSKGRNFSKAMRQCTASTVVHQVVCLWQYFGLVTQSLAHHLCSSYFSGLTCCNFDGCLQISKKVLGAFTDTGAKDKIIHDFEW